MTTSKADWEEHLPPLDRAIGALIEDLVERNMLDDVLIYCAGEFGRTPLMNGHAGRDHWSKLFHGNAGRRWNSGRSGGRIQ